MRGQPSQGIGWAVGEVMRTRRRCSSLACLLRGGCFFGAERAVGEGQTEFRRLERVLPLPFSREEGEGAKRNERDG